MIICVFRDKFTTVNIWKWTKKSAPLTKGDKVSSLVFGIVHVVIGHGVENLLEHCEPPEFVSSVG